MHQGSEVPNGETKIAFALPKFDIGRAGRVWKGSEVADRLSRLGECQIEVIDGQLFGNEYQRRMLLGMLLENTGLDVVIGLAEPNLWQQALAARIAKKRTG